MAHNVEKMITEGKPYGSVSTEGCHLFSLAEEY
jgi:hypothetical protein